MSIKIMIVDDDRDDIDLFIEAVKELDPSVQCISAINGLSGLDIVHSAMQKPDYIFVDMNMPKMNGKQFVSEIRKNSLYDHITLVIYSTSKPLDTDLFGADEFISKPTSQDELCLAISKVISSHYDKIRA